MPRIGRPPRPEPLRFFRFVADEGDCWLWTETTNRGYGHFRRADGTRVYAHRWAYEHLVVEVPDGLQLDHLCRVRHCVNPWHLEPVTPRVNTLRSAGVTAQRASQTECASGHPFDEANTRNTPRGRECRSCRAQTLARYRARKKASS